MAQLCSNAEPSRHEIKDGGRRLELLFRVDWGLDDLRDAHEKPLVFCSFHCLSEWADQKAADHDGHTVREG